MELAPGFHAARGPARALQPDRAAIGSLVIRDPACLLKCKGCCALTSAMRQRGEIRQLPEDRHLCGDVRGFFFFFFRSGVTRGGLRDECVAAAPRDDASDNSSLWRV